MRMLVFASSRSVNRGGMRSGQEVMITSSCGQISKCLLGVGLKDVWILDEEKDPQRNLVLSIREPLLYKELRTSMA